MRKLESMAAFCAFALVAGCEMKVGKGDGEPTNAAANVSAEGKSEDGKISLKAPGFDLAFDLPEGLSEHVNVDSNSKIIYPGSSIGGMHIAAGGEGGSGESEVEMRFNTADAVDKVVAWYRHPARADGFTLGSATRESGGFVIAGATKGDGDGFKVHLSERSGGGTEGRMTIHDKR